MEIGVFEKTLSKINVRADMKYLNPILEFVRKFAECEGLSSRTASLLEVAVEEACVNVIKHAYASDEDGDFDVIISKRPHQLVVSIEDRGLPTDLAALEKNENNSLGVTLMKSIADEIIFQNLGERGKCVKLIKNLPSEHLSATAESEQKDDFMVGAAGKQTAHSEDGDVKIRFMAVEEALNLSKCVYYSYGYTYTSTFYYPEKIAEMINSGILKSVVAVNNKGEIVAHLGLKFPYPGAKIAESAQAAVLPQYRGKHIFEDMKKFSARYAGENGIFGLYSESVTIHPYTQKANIALGAKETGLVLAFIPETAFFKKIQDADVKPQRQAAMLFYMKTYEGPERDIYSSERHIEIISKIYEHNGLKRTLKKSDNITLTSVSAFEINFNSYLNSAIILVNSIGKDFGPAVKNYRRELCEKRADCVYVFVPLSSEAAAAAMESLEKLNFSFAGVIPEYFSGDCAIYQYLNNVSVDPERIFAVSDFAKTLKEYVIKEYNNAKIYEP